MHCCICGDDDRLSHPRRFWSPDDGWRMERFCRACLPLARVRPKPEDYAYARGGELADVDEAIDVLFG